MILVIGNVLAPEEVVALRDAAGDLVFEDGRTTAGRYARDVKSNLQARPGRDLDALLGVVQERLLANEVVRSAARPRGVARMLVSRYTPGMEYGLHVDDAIMNGRRTDLSFTLPLSDPADYEGGGLVIADGVEDRVFRLGAGDMILYPTSALHRVDPVTSGERLAVVGWLTSRVRDPARREILHDLDVAARGLFDRSGKNADFDRLLKARSNLERLWADD